METTGNPETKPKPESKCRRLQQSVAVSLFCPSETTLFYGPAVYTSSLNNVLGWCQITSQACTKVEIDSIG